MIGLFYYLSLATSFGLYFLLDNNLTLVNLSNPKVLLAVFGLGVFVLLLTKFSFGKITLKTENSYSFLSAFLIYYTVNVILQRGAIDVFDVLFNSTSGFLFYFILGQGFRINVSVIDKKIRETCGFNFILIIIFLIFPLTLGGVLALNLLDIFKNIGDSKFLLRNPVPYQHVTNLITISYIVNLFVLDRLYFYLVHVHSKVALNVSMVKAFVRFIMFVSLAIPFVQMIFISITTQAIGSNKGLFLSLILLGAFYVSVLRSEYRSAHNSTAYRNGLFKKIINNKSLISLVLISSTLFCFIFNLDFSFIGASRIMGYGDGFGGFLNSRLFVFNEYFNEQFSISPFFGTLDADGIIGRPGAHMHFLPAFLLVETGILGFSIFSLYIILIFCESFRSTGYISADKTVNTKLNTFVLASILLAAILATSLHWSVLWFALGFSHKLVSFK